MLCMRNLWVIKIPILVLYYVIYYVLLSSFMYKNPTSHLYADGPASAFRDLAGPDDRSIPLPEPIPFPLHGSRTRLVLDSRHSLSAIS